MDIPVYILADNQDISKAGIRYLLKENGFDGDVYEAAAKKDLIKLLSENERSIVVLDYTNFDFSNVEDLLIVASRYCKVSWLLFSEELSLPFLKRISIENSFSVLLKNSTEDEILTALEMVQNGKRYICHSIEHHINSQDVKSAEKPILTSTEQEILRQVAAGMSAKDIAEERSVSIHTITTHKKNIFRKLDVNNVHEASKYAFRSGLVDATDYYI
jgi:DNA-binding NarL/FixJ family response regulator